MSKLFRTTEERLWLEVTQLRRQMADLQRQLALPVYRRVTCSGGLTLSGANQDVPGLTITPGRPGTYLVWCFLDITVSPANNTTNSGSFAVTAGTLAGSFIQFLDAAGGPIARATVGQDTTWTCPSDTDSIKVQAIGSANAVVNATHSSLLVLRVGP